MRVYCAVNATDVAGVARESRMNSQYSEYEARMRRIRRNERLAGCALLVVTAILMAIVLWLALVGFLVVFGGA